MFAWPAQLSRFPASFQPPHPHTTKPATSIRQRTIDYHPPSRPLSAMERVEALQPQRGCRCAWVSSHLCGGSRI
jgi:hypothetical protein